LAIRELAKQRNAMIVFIIQKGLTYLDVAWNIKFLLKAKKFPPRCRSCRLLCQWEDKLLYLKSILTNLMKYLGLLLGNRERGQIPAQLQSGEVYEELGSSWILPSCKEVVKVYLEQEQIVMFFIPSKPLLKAPRITLEPDAHTEQSG